MATQLWNPQNETMIEYMQYNRHGSIELKGLGKVVNNKLDETTISNFEDIGVGKIEPWQVHAYHRLKTLNKTIIGFISRKFAALALHNRKKLRNLDKAKHGLSEECFHKYKEKKGHIDFRLNIGALFSPEVFCYLKHQLVFQFHLELWVQERRKN